MTEDIFKEFITSLPSLSKGYHKAAWVNYDYWVVTSVCDITYCMFSDKFKQVVNKKKSLPRPLPWNLKIVKFNLQRENNELSIYVLSKQIQYFNKSTIHIKIKD